MHWRDIHRTAAVVTHPTFEVMSRTEAKLQLQVDTTADDALIDSLILAARQQVETDTNRRFPSVVVDLFFDAFPCERTLILPYGPVSAIASVKSYDDDNVEAEFSSTSYYKDLKSEPGRVVLLDNAAWPTDLRPANGGVVRFTAGYTGTAKAIASMTRSGTTATVTTSAAHGFTKGQRITIVGADQDDYNGSHLATVTGATTFTFTVTGSPTTPATGTMTATYLGIPDRFFQAMKLWMAHLFRPESGNDVMVQRVYDSLVSDALFALG